MRPPSALAAAERLVADITGARRRGRDRPADAASLPPLRRREAEAAAALPRLTIAREQLEAEEARVAAALAEAEARAVQLDADTARERDLVTDAEVARAGSPKSAERHRQRGRPRPRIRRARPRPR